MCRFEKWALWGALAALLPLVPPARAQSGPVVWAARSLQRIGLTDAAGTNTQAQLWAARGEYESFQIVVRAPSGNALSNVNVTVSDLTGANGTIPKSALSLFREQYVQVKQNTPDHGGSNRPIYKPGYFTDGLIPFTDPATGAPPTSGSLRAVPFSVAAGNNQPIWVDILVPRSAAAGLYNGTFTVTSDQGSATGQIALNVWNFTLPLKSAFRSTFMNWSNNTVAAQQELLRNRVESGQATTSAERGLIDQYGLNASGLGYYSGADISSCTMSAAPSVTQLQSAAASHQSDLFLYDYSADEIDTCANLNSTLKQWGLNLHKAGVNNLVTMTPNPNLFDDGSGSGRSAVDIWVVLPSMYNGGVSYVKQALAKGDQVWSYTTLSQDSYSPKWQMDYDPINFRIQQGFISQSLNITGFLYWQIDRFGSDPWNVLDNYPGFPGDGMLVYPGSTVGVSGIVPSQRLKWVRDGVDDYDYIQLLKNAGQTDFAMQVVRTVGADWTNWTKDSNALEAARIQLGNELDRLGGGNSATQPGTPGTPNPASGATGVALTPTITWGAASGATSYDVYFGTGASPALVKNQAGTSYQPGTLTASTKYYWKVVAKNANGSASSAVWSFTTQASQTQAPGTPAILSPANGASGVALAPTLAWSAASNATSYDVYFGATSAPALVKNQTGTSFLPGTLTAGTAYYWKVVAKNTAGSTSSAVASFSTQAVQAQKPGTPALLAPANGASGVAQSVTLSWSAASNATSYDVYFGTSSSPALVASQAGTGFAAANLTAGSTYYWRVVAKNAAGTSTSAVWSFTVASSTPTPTSASLSVSPSSGSGLSATFQFSYSNPNGYTALSGMNALFATAVNGNNSCWVYYDRRGGRLWLARDNMAYWDSMALGSGGQLQNSQCTVNVGAARVTASGANLTLSLPITFKTRFAGTKYIYMRAGDATGQFTNYKARGTWTVPRQ